MFVRRILNLMVFLGLVASLGLSLAGCGGGQNDPKLAQLKPGDMPAGGDWTGVYYSTLYGYLHLLAEGDTASGAWRSTAGDAWGEMSGKITGDVFRYEWHERKIGAVGASAERKGKGYFRYLIPREGEAHEIIGEWGLKQDEAGNEWKAVKQVNMKPDPKSVKPDEVEGRGVGGGWDKQESGPEGEGEGESGGGESGGD